MNTCNSILKACDSKRGWRLWPDSPLRPHNTIETTGVFVPINTLTANPWLMNYAERLGRELDGSLAQDPRPSQIETLTNIFEENVLLT